MTTVITRGEDGAVAFKCPGCGYTHSINTGVGKGPRWTWNGDVEQPTFTPSILVTTVRPGMTDDDWERYDEQVKIAGFGAVLAGEFGWTCHSFVTAGNIQFLGDCSHALKNTTVPLPPWNAKRPS